MVHRSTSAIVADSLAEDAADFLRVAVDRVEQPGEAKAQDGACKER